MRDLKINPAITTFKKVDIVSCQLYLQQIKKQFKQLFLAKKPIEFLMQQHVAIIDELLRAIWKKYIPTTNNILLIAVGGYGRGELHPYSDIDLLILSQHVLNDSEQQTIYQFVQFCWDIGLEIRHSVRTQAECLEIAKQDVSVFTNLLEANLLLGDEVFLTQFLKQAIEHCWSDVDFYHAKMQELEKRYQKYGDTFSNLEPNIKNGLGSLRDIHTIFWLAKKFVPIETILQKEELEELLKAQKLLWNIRYAIHFFAERKEDRLLFDYQTKLAEFFDFYEKNNNLAVERFMKNFFVTIKSLQEVITLVLQFFYEYLEARDFYKEEATYTDAIFSISKQNILFVHDVKKFQSAPENIMKLFLTMASNEQIRHISFDTIRMIRQSRKLMNQEFLENKINNQSFLQLLKQSDAVDHALFIMNKFGVLGHFIEPFQQVIGQMQYDLFHIYTVDQHSLFVVKQLCQFRKQSSQLKFPLCHELMLVIKQPELLFIAAIFHDIGKGQGGDHSELGAQYVEMFCQRLQLNTVDTALIIWLVKNHLLMSHTAQKNDIFDPEVIKQFVKQVESIERLRYLYLLTVADICSTNPKLWNSWKDTLLQELFRQAQMMLTKKNNKLMLIRQKKQQVMDMLSNDFSSKAIKNVWQHFEKDYFLRETIDNIAWQTKQLVSLESLPFITTRLLPSQSTLEIFIVSQYHVNLFAITTTILSNLSFNIVEATIRMTKEGLCLSSYIVLMPEQEINYEQLKKTIMTYYKTPDKLPLYRQRRLPRELKYFLCPTEVTFSIDTKNNRTVMELVSLDRPGLLAQVSQAFVTQNIHLQMAKIMTMGEKVEDIFFITDINNQAIREHAKQIELKNKILHILQEK